MSGQEFEKAQEPPQSMSDYLDEIEIVFAQAGLSEEEKYNRYRVLARELDEKYGYLGQECFYSGNGSEAVPNYDEATGQCLSIGIQSGHIEPKQGTSLGFYRVITQEYKGMYYKFYTGTHTISPCPNVISNHECFDFVSARDCSVIPSSEFNGVFTPDIGKQEEFERILAALPHYSDELVGIVTSDSFRKRSHKKQISIVDGFIESVRPRGEVINMPMVFSGPFIAHCKIFGNDGEIVDATLGFGEGARLEGDYLDVGFLERDLLAVSGLRRLIDFRNRQAGVCLIISPREEAVEGINDLMQEAELVPGSLLSLPISGQPKGFSLELLKE